eukprot:jgi/Galph1/65/GphlegSOOS_G4812.1
MLQSYPIQSCPGLFDITSAFCFPVINIRRKYCFWSKNTFSCLKRIRVDRVPCSLICCGEVIGRDAPFRQQENYPKSVVNRNYTEIVVNKVKDHLEWEAALRVWKTVRDYEIDLKYLDIPLPDELDFSSCTFHLISRKNKEIVGVARYMYYGTNIQIDRVAVLPEFRGQGIGRAMIEKILTWTAPREGALFVRAYRHEMGFYSILGFECQSFLEQLKGTTIRKMVFVPPVCSHPTNCVGLHHTSIHVANIERSLAFYGILGFIVTSKFFTKEGSRACFMEGMGTRLELLEHKEALLSEKRPTSVTGYGVLSFNVTKACTDLDSYLSDIRRRNGGILEIKSPPQEQVIGCEVMETAVVKDPDGVPLEFIRKQTVLQTVDSVDW